MKVTMTMKEYRAMVESDYRPLDLDTEDYQENENIMTFSNDDVCLIYKALKSYKEDLQMDEREPYIEEIDTINEILLEIDSQEVPF